MGKCRRSDKNINCGPTTPPPSKLPPCDPVNVCLSFGRRLVWENNCLSVTGKTTIEDGWYGQVQVMNGCIVDARPAPVAVFTPASCAPATAGCGSHNIMAYSAQEHADDSPLNINALSDSGIQDNAITLNPSATNLLSYVGGMLDAELFFGEHHGVIVDGYGTRNDPLQFTVQGESAQLYMMSGSPDIIHVQGNGSEQAPFTVSFEQTKLTAGWHGAYEVDMYGRIIGFDESRTGIIKGVVDGDRISLQVENALLTANLQDSPVIAGQYTTGGYTYTVDQKGLITRIQRDITVSEGTYQFGHYQVEVNVYGSITRIEAVSVDRRAIPDTFVGSFRGQNESEDTQREMSFTTELEGPIHVEYRGAVGYTNLAPGIVMGFPAGVSIMIDDLMMTEPLMEIMGGTENTIMVLRATSTNDIAAGPHTISVVAPTARITQSDGFMRAQIVGRGT